ncbi:Oxysterol-binding protein [Wickerhamomyces ciferrii]|uniref:Oxysterol-binding protein n=1 Tax=Wickerhamomyces ciferrii (strain ATCC 14091 / BCRC 22168 / CBS 111 / JCM 3599 / NBRC 0793 / NRRL Y-1031 F-60-10) TaxID=1206466 RepID=K0KKF3_WICCF|nr:Oxysterol-binding protein [Wickerhamomyces ciferrii]CCH43441.1 Oxysterol-binding protein [Wickerhamomyces ciferrii]
MSSNGSQSQVPAGSSGTTANSNQQPVANSASTSSSGSSAINPPLFKLKILDALKNNNFDQLKQLVLSVQDSVNYYELSLVKNLIFNLAVQVAPLQIIQRLLSDEAKELAIDVNYQDENGNAPLHLAAINSRYDIAQLLLRDERINDTILNNDLKQPIEVAKDLKIVSLLQNERALYVEKVANDLRQSFTNHDFAKLDEILSSSRNFELLDINGSDPETGDTVLHEFVKKNDIGMVKWILSHGGDPFRRDKKGKLPIELVGKTNETMKKIIKDASQDQNVISSTSGRSISGTMKAPTFKGYLRKWTNFASGYKLRWFILDSNGILSYYKSQEDTMNACRGSLNMKSALLHLDSSEKQKFEIISKSGVRWHLKGNHPIETNRWVWSLQGSIRFAKDKERARLSSETERKQSFDIENSRHNSNVSSNNDGVPTSRVPTQVSSNLTEIKENESLNQINNNDTSENRNVGLNRRPSEIVYNSDEDNDDDEFDQESREIGLPEENEDIDVDSGPYIQEISVLKRGFSLELSSLKELLIGVKGSLDHDSEPLNISLGTVEALNNSFEKLNHLVLKRDERLIHDLQKQKDINELWINSIRDLENELLAKNNELQTFESERRNLKKALTRKFSSASGSFSTPTTEVTQSPFDTQGIKSGTTITSAGISSPNKTGHGPSPLGFGVTGAVAGVAAKVGAAIGAPGKPQEQGTTTTDAGSFVPNDENVDPATKIDHQPIDPIAGGASYDQNDAEISRFLNEEEDSDDEFFDAADFDDDDDDDEQGVVGSTQQTDSTVATTPQPSDLEQEQLKQEQQVGEVSSTGVDDSQLSNELQKQKNLVLSSEGSYKGYEFEPRKELSLKVDNRPKVGLWGILKSMIGKDMTKISLPVFFNEPTSLLQRVAEDLEYSDLLNQAASFEDSTLRLLYVSAFAASEYGSTTDRVAKPFNPLLGETYEYSRPDLGFRFITEQVSHHPPVSAALAEAIKWDYYGETSVKSAFNGRSFDVQPLGNWYLHLRPDCMGNDEEIYSWKKLSTSVVGIVVGNPSIDNYGEMIITNSKTGDKAILNFKPRGWRGASAYEMSGVIYNSKGEKSWSIGGHWNNKIFAKKVIKNNTSIATSDNNSKKIGNVPIEDGQKFLIWQTTPRPKVPFNLTSYAITLNEGHPDLVPFLSRGDTRLRPDQRAMENGLYDDASNFKNEVEVKQRMARKQREEQGIDYKPSYFIKEIHPVTKEEYWKYNGDYWKLRNEGKLKEIDIF